MGLQFGESHSVWAGELPVDQRRLVRLSGLRSEEQGVVRQVSGDVIASEVEGGEDRFTLTSRHWRLDRQQVGGRAGRSPNRLRLPYTPHTHTRTEGETRTASSAMTTTMLDVDDAELTLFCCLASVVLIDLTAEETRSAQGRIH
jgi:hypothetical protein